MATSLPKKIPFRREHTGDPAIDRAQRMGQQLAPAQEQIKALVATLINSVYTALAINVTIGVTAYAQLLSATIATTLTSGHLDITFSASGINSTAAANARFLVLVDGVAAKGVYAYTAAGQTFSGAIIVRVPVKAGKHTVAVQWKSDAGAARIFASTVAEEHANLLVQEAA